jgi:hypothetical protein
MCNILSSIWVYEAGGAFLVKQAQTLAEVMAGGDVALRVANSRGDDHGRREVAPSRGRGG